jgi:hypothetical protein
VGRLVVSLGRVLARDLRSSHDLVGAGAQAAAALLLTIACALLTDPPAVAWTVFAWVGVCGLLFLVTAARSAQDGQAGGGPLELRGVLLAALLLAQLGFLLRLAGPGVAAPGREAVVFIAGALAFLGVREAGRRSWPMAVWAGVVGALLLGALIAVVLTPHPGGPRLQWQHTLPAAVLAVSGAGAFAGWWVLRPGRVPPEAIRAHVVAVPPLAVYAFTRDPGAAMLTFGASTAVTAGAGLLLWRSHWTAVLRSTATGAAAAAAGGVGLRILDPFGIFTVPAAGYAHDLLGVPEVAGAVRLDTAGGRFGTAMVLVLAALFAAQVLLLIARVLRRGAEGPDRGRSAFLRVWAVAAGGQVLVSVLVPLLAALLARPGPAMLAALPFASDGASFVVTFAALGLLYAAGEQRGEAKVGNEREVSPPRRADG